MTSVLSDYNDIMSKYDPENNKTKNILTKYEQVKIIGLRAEQLQRGSPPAIKFKVDEDNPFDPRAIAHEELKQRKIPFMICRKLSDGSLEYWRLDDMIITNFQ